MGAMDKDKEAEVFYKTLLASTKYIFDEYNSKKELDLKSIQKKIKMTCEFVQQERNRVVHVMQTAERYNNPHVDHAVRSTIVAIIIGINLKLPRHQLIELGVAGLLNNISVLNLTSQIYTNSEDGMDMFTRGTEIEKRLLYVHPIHAHKILKSFNFPIPICEAVLQHHELEDGSGFPQHLKGDSICLYAKILVVAGFYEAFSMEHVDGEKCGHRGIVQILKNSGTFDPLVLRALVNSISIYPIGIYVLLSNGERGQVVDIDQENPRFPTVKIFKEQQSVETVKTSDELSIVRPLTSEEVECFNDAVY